MAIHDAYARVTPFEVAFQDADTAHERMARIREAAEADGMQAALRDPGRFLSLPAVAEVVHQMREPGSGTGQVQKHGILLFHAFHFEEAGRPVYLLRAGVARYLVETEGRGGFGEPVVPGREAEDDASSLDSDALDSDAAQEERPMKLPADAGYLQLPRQLFWMAPKEEGPPEPVDGLFWAVPDGERLSLLVIGGMREDRPGFSVVPLPPVPMDDAGKWLRARVREEGPDFETTLPGGDLDRLYSFVATGEVLKLVARTFRYVEDHPEAVSGGEDLRDQAGEREPEPGEPRPTALPFRGIHLEDQAGRGEGDAEGRGARAGSEQSHEER